MFQERIIATCLENKIAVYSPHTSFDAVVGGVNDWLASAFGMICWSEFMIPKYFVLKKSNLFAIENITKACIFPFHKIIKKNICF